MAPIPHPEPTKINVDSTLSASPVQPLTPKGLDEDKQESKCQLSMSPSHKMPVWNFDASVNTLEQSIEDYTKKIENLIKKYKVNREAKKDSENLVTS